MDIGTGYYNFFLCFLKLFKRKESRLKLKINMNATNIVNGINLTRRKKKMSIIDTNIPEVEAANDGGVIFEKTISKDS